ncbi:MAG: DegV family protein [Chloroflexota bacterium]
MKVAIVTDSTADLSTSLVESYDIHVVPNLLIIDGESLEDNKDISRQEFYERLPWMKNPPTTATASTGTYQQLYEELLQGGAYRILSIHAASLLSGIYNAASAAAQAFGERVQVIDSQQITLGLGFQVLAAAEAVAHGLPFDKVISLIDDVRRRIRVIAMLDTLEYVRRSGRVSWARAQISNLLRVKPFLEVREGQVLRLGEARTRQNGVKRLMQFLLSLNALERLAILHTNAEADARQFLADLAPDLPTTPLIVNVTTIIGTHVGPNGLGFAAVPRTVI